jgi:hypothetical protein
MRSAIEFHAFAPLEMSMRVTNCMPRGAFDCLPVGTSNDVAPLKAPNASVFPQYAPLAFRQKFTLRNAFLEFRTFGRVQPVRRKRMCELIPCLSAVRSLTGWHC